MLLRLLTLATAALLAPCGVIAQPTEDADEPRWLEGEFGDDLVHSLLPIYGFSWEEFWPRNFYDEESFGCTSRVAFGDWRFVPNPADDTGREGWVRISNYGVFHCAANFYEARGREILDDGDFDRGFFAKIGTLEAPDGATELWVMQKGMRTGSDYILLARAPGDDIIEQFFVLQRRCPPQNLLRKDDLDTWLTAYCLIETHDELLSLGTEMLNFPPLGTLELQKGPDALASGPSDSRNSE